MSNEIFEYEAKKLEKVIDIIDQKIKIEDEEFSKQEHFIIGFKEGMRGTQFTREALMSLHATEREALKRTRNNPYFGRFVFKDKDGEEEIYIGKKMITDLDQQVIAYDWRSPICSMYYDYNIGRAKYFSRGHVEEGEILSKRAIEIKNGKLIKAIEVDSSIEDEILLEYLDDGMDSRLKSIVATIQKEQNAIIRSPMDNHYIVSGVAGSGKTTVALHRVAYLLYNYARNVRDEEFMILGPNQYFLDYISDLLPDLDIHNISQSTFDGIALGSMKGKIKLEDKNATLERVLQGKMDEEVLRFKNSIDYLRLIESFASFYVQSHLQEDLTYEGIILASSKTIQEVCGNIQNMRNGLSNKAKEFMKRKSQGIKQDASDISHRIWEQYREEFLSLPKDSPRRQEILDLTEGFNKEIKKGCPTVMKDYFQFISVSPIALYGAFLEYAIGLGDAIPLAVRESFKESATKLSKKVVSYEDLTAMTYLNFLMNGNKDFDSYSHLIIDEAQDLSIAQYYVLKKMFPKCKFEIFGDPNQAIYEYQSVDFEELNHELFGDKAVNLSLNKSYRTTKQIADVSNLLLGYEGKKESDTIARLGKDIVVNHLESVSDYIAQLDTILNDGYQNVGIICRDEKSSKELFDELKKEGIEVSFITSENSSYASGVSILPAYLSKGLEFDAVIIDNASSDCYQDHGIDMKLLYVALTRPMHELFINYSGEITPALKSLVKEKQYIKKESL